MHSTQNTPTNTNVFFALTSNHLTGHGDRVWCATWHPTKPILATCSGDKTVRIWQATNAQDPTQWQCTNILEGGHKRTIRSVAWSPDGRQLATGSFDATTGVWERDEEEGGGKSCEEQFVSTREIICGEGRDPHSSWM